MILVSLSILLEGGLLYLMFSSNREILNHSETCYHSLQQLMLILLVIVVIVLSLFLKLMLSSLYYKLLQIHCLLDL